MDRAKGVHFPGMPGFNLNTNTDTLLKRDFDQYRGKGPHPFMVANGLGHLIPFEHEHLSLWETSLHFGLSPNHFNTVHESTNILFGGGLDDVWINPETSELHIVDYKSTANLSKEPKPVSLEGPWKEGYKRQMDMYQWIMRRKGFTVSDIGYFVYVDGQHVGYNRMIDDDTEMATMKFKTSLLTYKGDDSWVEPALFKIKDLLVEKDCPKHAEKCENGIFLKEVKRAIDSSRDE
ncbi:MAG: hypothetical protein P8N58_04005 [Emcibacteraceae bacterium]|nr:hypothetical protein [Emcibacteraceae bacterium]